MSKSEIGRMLVNNITLIEYENADKTSSFFIQSGVAGFYATKSELRDLYGILSYYYNIDIVNNTVISVK
jgi:hypothetical protein